ANGRRTEMASVPPPAATQAQEAKEQRLLSAGNVLGKLRAIASPDFTAGSGFRGGASTPGAYTPRAIAKEAPPAPVNQSPVTPIQGAGVSMTGQVRLSADQRELEMVMRPYFQSVGRPSVNLPLIPGGSSR